MQTNARPVSVGRASSKEVSASKPPAEAPMPTVGTPLESKSGECGFGSPMTFEKPQTSILCQFANQYSIEKPTFISFIGPCNIYPLRDDSNSLKLLRSRDDRESGDVISSEQDALGSRAGFSPEREST